jgi:hypothetical protein
MEQATVPLRVFTTHLFFKPKDTCRGVLPALQLLPSLAHFENPLGQSAAEAAPAKASRAAKVINDFLNMFTIS